MNFYSNSSLTSQFNPSSQTSTTVLPEKSLEFHFPFSNVLDRHTSSPYSSYSSISNFSEKSDLDNSTDILSDSTSVSSRNVFSFIYQGIANIVYGVIDPITNTITNIFRKTVQTFAAIREPASTAGTVENNLFNLVIQSATQNQEGDFSFFSALPFDGFLAQYWQFQYDGNTGFIQGELTNPNTSIALATNGLTVNETLPGMPYIGFPSYVAMQAGSTISGFITNNQIQVQITGFAPGLVSSGYIFEITTDLQRVN